VWKRKFFFKKNLPNAPTFFLFTCFNIQNRFKNTEKESKRNHLNSFGAVVGGSKEMGTFVM
jgi:hypothetical protein